MTKIWSTIKESLEEKERDWTTGSINRAVILLSIPMILEMAMESLFAIVDIFFVSKIGPEAVATVGLTETFLTLVYSLAWGMAGAATAIVARRVGEKDPEKASEAGAQAILVAIGMAAVIGVFGVFFARDLLKMMGASVWAQTEGLLFAQIMLGSNVVIMLLYLNNGILRAAGDASTAMRVLWLANAVNIVLDPIFIFGIGSWDGFGVAGAAIATSIGRGVGVGYQFYRLSKGGTLKLKMAYFKPILSIWRRLLELAAGTAGQFLIASASWIVLMRLVADFGDAAVAGYTIAFRIFIFTLLPSWGMAMAAATLVGQNLGAGKIERAEQSAWRTGKWNSLFLLAASVVTIVFAEPIFEIFTSEKAVIEVGTFALRVIAAGYYLYGWGMVISQAINGAGDTRTPTIINFIGFWLIETPLAWFLVKKMDWGHAGVAWSIPFAETILALMCIWWFRKGAWKKVEV